MRPLALAVGILMTVTSSTAAAQAPAVDPAAPTPGPALTFDELVVLELGADERYRIERLADTVFYALFDSRETRQEVFEGFAEEILVSLGSPVALTISENGLRRGYSQAAVLHGIAAQFRLDLRAAGMLRGEEDGARRALITLVRSTDGGEIFDFSYSRRLQAVDERREALDRLAGGSSAETGSLSVEGATHPTVELFESWRFDDLDRYTSRRGRQEDAAERLWRARRAALTAELTQALFYVDPAYEAAIVAWIETELDAGDQQTLAQLLQLAGFHDMEAEIFVKEIAPQLYDPRVLQAGLYRQLERVTTRGRKEGSRRLARQSFRSEEVMRQARAFYARFFEVNDRGEFEFSLTDEMRGFVGRQSSRIHDLSAPILAAHFGPGWLTPPR